MAITYNNVKTRKKYLIGGFGAPFAYADTLAEARKAGLVVAKKVAYKGRWNTMFISIPIDVRTGKVSYKATGLRMYVPVRGSGKRLDYIVAEIKRRHGVAPFVWTKK